MCKFPMNLQFFAEGGESGNGNQNNNAGEGNSNQNAGNNNQNSSPNATTYTQEQLDGIVNSRVTRAEKSALKSFFEQQGMSEEEINNAISTYKANKEANKPDVEGMQSQLSQMQQDNQRLQVESAAILQAIKSGISTETVPYVLKMADLSKAMGADGKVNDEEVKNAIDKVLEDVPALKPSAESSKGFTFGAPGNNDNGGNNGADGSIHKPATKRWNRFNN